MQTIILHVRRAEKFSVKKIMYNDVSMLIAFLFVWVMLLLAFAVIVYLVMSFGLYFIAKKRNLESPLLAFVPIVNYFILGKIATSEVAKENKKTILMHAGWVLNLIHIIIIGSRIENSLFLLLQFIAATLVILIRMYYMYKVTLQFGGITALNLVLTFLGLEAFVYLYLGLKKTNPDTTKQELS